MPFVLQEQIGAISSLFKRYENVPASLADAALIRLAEICDSPLLLATDTDFHIDRRHGRQAIPLLKSVTVTDTAVDAQVCEWTGHCRFLATPPQGSLPATEGQRSAALPARHELRGLRHDSSLG